MNNCTYIYLAICISQVVGNRLELAYRICIYIYIFGSFIVRALSRRTNKYTEMSIYIYMIHICIQYIDVVYDMRRLRFQLHVYTYIYKYIYVLYI